MDIHFVFKNKDLFNAVMFLAKEFPQLSIQNNDCVDDLLEPFNNMTIDYLVVDHNNWLEMSKTCHGIKALFLNIKCLLILDSSENISATERDEFCQFFGSGYVLNKTTDSPLKQMSIFYDYIHKDDFTYTNTHRSLVPINAKLLDSVLVSPCDIFLKISNNKFIKVVNFQDRDISSIVEKYKAKGVGEFYIDLLFYNHFKTDLINSLLNKVDVNKLANPTEQVKLTSQVLDVAKDFGVSTLLLDGINQTFGEITQDFKTKKSLQSFLEKLKSLDGTILGNHTYLLTIVLMSVAKKLPWCTKEVKKNLCTAALLHDLELVNSGHEYLEFCSLKDILTKDIITISFIKNHSLKLAESFSKNDDIKTDIINLIAKHHESSDGFGYPKGLSAPQLSPPNHLFNVAHQFTIELYKIGFNYSKIDEVFINLKNQFPNQTYSTYISLIESEFKLMN